MSKHNVREVFLSNFATDLVKPAASNALNSSCVLGKGHLHSIPHFSQLEHLILLHILDPSSYTDIFLDIQYNEMMLLK
ncbi:18585_t:CDS:2 [Dentiscutata erythropus]|uniref:18585_t:CDS:1 n=1 Tax=Dentiscutata erythropus TaxID=1348616 RepID=A0A9N9HKE3_9GLOM|nr:18585_t:CDS:2 [Dentiscutata erythropus]